MITEYRRTFESALVSVFCLVAISSTAQAADEWGNAERAICVRWQSADAGKT